MSEEPKITMNEFRTIVEEFRSEQKKLAEYVLHIDKKMNDGFEKMEKRFDHVDRRFDIVNAEISSLKTDVSILKTDVSALKTNMDSLQERVDVLHEGQTEIKDSLKQKIGREEFDGLEKRVARVENKVA